MPNNTTNPTIKTARRNNYGDIILNFNEEKIFNVEGEEIKTNLYGELKIALDSFILAFAGVTDNNSISEAIKKLRKFLLSHEIER